MNGVIAVPHVVSDTISTVTPAPSCQLGWIHSAQPREATVWAATDVTVDLDLGATRLVTLVALVATTASQWWLYGAASQAALDGAAVVASGPVVAGQGVGALWWDPSGLEQRWWRVRITGGTALAVGRVVLSDAWQPGLNFEFGGVQGRAPGPEWETSAGGSIYVVPRPQRRRWTLTWADVTHDEWRGRLDALDAYSSRGGEVVVVRDPDPANPHRLMDSLYGVMSIPAGTARRRVNRYRAAAVFEELV